jgi:dihydrofolate synthase/folylpolyglutamate synthase
MAFDYFASSKVDVAVIETGLGGRLDSTNIIAPELSIITNISYDHSHLLGDTLEKIAGEKAGIIKKNIPVLVGESQKATNHVFINKAKDMESPVYYADQILHHNN